MTGEGIEIAIWSRDLSERKFLGNPTSAKVTVRHNLKATGGLVVPVDHPTIELLNTPGSRVVFRDIDLDKTLCSGPVRAAGGDQDSLNFTVDGDFRLFENTLGWVKPNLPIEQQGAVNGSGPAYDKITAPAETVIKYYVRRNYVERLGRPLSIAPDLGRGPVVSASLRMHPLYDRLFPVVDGAGIDATGLGVRVEQVGRQMVLDCYMPNSMPTILTEDSGAILKWSWSRKGPDATRVAVGGPGEAQLREWRTVVDSALEDEYADVIERVRDARDVQELNSPLLYTRGQETLTEGTAKSGLSLTLSETEGFQYGKKVSVGDSVMLRLTSGIDIGPDVLREAEFSWTTEGGYTVVPTVGERSDDPNRALALLLRKMARALVRNNVEG